MKLIEKKERIEQINSKNTGGYLLGGPHGGVREKTAEVS